MDDANSNLYLQQLWTNARFLRKLIREFMKQMQQYKFIV